MIVAASACVLCIDPLAAQAATVSCSDAAAYAEQSLMLPAGLLKSIGSVETRNQPWSVNVDGIGHSFGSASEAISFVRSATLSGGHYVDVGCFQIDLLYHPDAFATLEAAFDPISNAMAAGRFLLSLEQATSSWSDAVGRYHSSRSPLAAVYAERVYAAIDDAHSVANRAKTHLDDTMFGVRVINPSWARTLHSSIIRVAGLPTMQLP